MAVVEQPAHSDIDILDSSGGGVVVVEKAAKVVSSRTCLTACDSPLDKELGER